MKMPAIISEVPENFTSPATWRPALAIFKYPKRKTRGLPIGRPFHIHQFNKYGPSPSLRSRQQGRDCADNKGLACC